MTEYTMRLPAGHGMEPGDITGETLVPSNVEASIGDHVVIEDTNGQRLGKAMIVSIARTRDGKTRWRLGALL